MDDLKEHSKIIENFVASVRRQLKDHACCVYSNNIQYKCNLKEKEVTVVPDASISCRVYNKRKYSFFDIPRLVLEVISPSTEQYDHNEKKELYRQQEIDEYWILDGEKRKIEIYTLDYDQDGKPQYYLFNTVTEQNKDKLFIVHFPHIKICFDELFDVFSD